MPSHFLSNSPSTPTTKTSDLQNDTAVSLTSTSSSSTAPDMWSYLWIPFLMSLSKELTLARAATATTSSPSILPPSQLADDDSPSVPRCSAPDIKLNTGRWLEFWVIQATVPLEGWTTRRTLRILRRRTLSLLNRLVPGLFPWFITSHERFFLRYRDF